MAISAGVQGLVGLGQAVFSGRKKQERRLDEMAANSPMRLGNKAVNDYYVQQKARAMANPYQTASYINSMNNINSNAATALNSLQSRRSAIAGVGRINAMSNQSSANAVEQAVNQSNRANADYGQSVRMKYSDDDAVFNNNVLDPYQRKLQLQQMKAKAANDRFENGLKMVGDAASNAAAYAVAAEGGNSGSPSSSSQSKPYARTMEQTISTPRNVGMPQAPTTLMSNPMSNGNSMFPRNVGTPLVPRSLSRRAMSLTMQQNPLNPYYQVGNAENY